MKDEGLEYFERGLLLLGVLIFSFLGGAIFGTLYERSCSTHPVEEIVKADSLIKVNDSIKIKITELDSIKDAKIIEVKTLNNDSTIKLFYQLISK